MTRKPKSNWRIADVDILTGLKADDSYFAQRNALESLRQVPASQSGLTAPGSPQAITACPAAEVVVSQERTKSEYQYSRYYSQYSRYPSPP
ncbi:MAG TPA: hypothetical protein VNB49_01395 [Candidatus Dormibacteraeota bacterium]|nr:hypothetical protein [Candidatus Dormibacteraeota bacterium]